MSIVNALNELTSARKKIEDESRKQAQAILKPGLRQFLVDNPEVAALRWTQYTPHFNDGDPCEFGVYDLYAAKVGEKRDDNEDPEGDESGYQGSYHWKEMFGKGTAKELEKLEEVFQKAETELEAAFGDHVEVIVDRKGVHVNEYDHD